MSATAVLPRPETWPDLPDRDGYEYVEGRWVKLAVAAGPVVIAFNLINRLAAVAVPDGLGWALPPDVPYQIWPKHPRKYRKPDGSFQGRESLPDGRVPEGLLHTPPAIAIEVVSTGDRFSELEAKVEEYLEAGVELVWVLVPKTATVLAYRADGGISRLRSGDFLTADDILPGFKVPVAELFELTVG